MLPLPYCSDETLVDELLAIIRAGGRLGTDDQDPARVAHLLLMVDSEAGLTYRARAEALRTLIEEAFRTANDSEQIDDDTYYGIRILFGFHPEYRKEGVGKREEEAAAFLWRKPIKPQSFYKRHRRKVAALALDCLRAAYGQRDLPEEHEYEILEESRAYEVNADRQLWRTSVTTRFRSRVDQLSEFRLFEPTNDDPEVMKEHFGVLADGARVITRSPSGTRDGFNRIVIRLPRELAIGEEFTIGWEERLDLEKPTDLYANYFVAMEAANDNFQLELSVSFEADPPGTVWAFKAHPSENLRRLAPEHGETLEVDPDGVLRYGWDQTERRATYGLKWIW